MKFKHVQFLSHSVSLFLGVALGLSIAIHVTQNLYYPNLLALFFVPIIACIIIATILRVITIREFHKTEFWKDLWKNK